MQVLGRIVGPLTIVETVAFLEERGLFINRDDLQYADREISSVMLGPDDVVARLYDHQGVLPTGQMSPAAHVDVLLGIAVGGGYNRSTTRVCVPAAGFPKRWIAASCAFNRHSHCSIVVWWLYCVHVGWKALTVPKSMEFYSRTSSCFLDP